MTRVCVHCLSELTEKTWSINGRSGIAICNACDRVRARGLWPAVVYALVDPRDGLVRYIGCSVDAQQRRLQHRSGSNYQPRLKVWIKDIRQEQLCPEFVVLERFYRCAKRQQPITRAYVAEERWIARKLWEGHPLLNVQSLPKTEAAHPRKERAASQPQLRSQDNDNAEAGHS